MHLLSVRSFGFCEEIGNHVSVRKFYVSDLFYNVAVVSDLFIVKKQYFKRQEKLCLSLNGRRPFGYAFCSENVAVVCTRICVKKLESCSSLEAEVGHRSVQANDFCVCNNFKICCLLEFDQ
jgi:hypothetical protein